MIETQYYTENPSGKRKMGRGWDRRQGKEQLTYVMCIVRSAKMKPMNLRNQICTNFKTQEENIWTLTGMHLQAQAGHTQQSPCTPWFVKEYASKLH